MSNPLNLTEIDQEQALNLLRFFIRSNNSVFLIGQRGNGKTQISMQAIKDCGYKINYVNLSVVERPDIAGYPDLHSPGEIINFKSPYFLPSLTEGKKPDSILLFDEVDKAPHEITAPLLEILQSGTINGKKINCAGCVLTGNLSNEGAYSNPISSALLDRGAKYILKFNFDKWLDWAKLNGVHDLILGFLSRSPELACGEAETPHYASPSPRGWTLASEAIIKAKQLNMTDIESITGIISGFVGAEAGLKFEMWYSYFKRFEPSILSFIETGACSTKIEELSITEIFVFCTTLCHLAKRKIVESKIKAKHLQIAEYVVKFFNQYQVDDEVQLITMRNSFPFEFVAKYKLYESQIFLEKSKSLQFEVMSSK